MLLWEENNRLPPAPGSVLPLDGYPWPVDGPALEREGWRPEPPRPVGRRSELEHPELQALYDFWRERATDGLVQRRAIDVLDLRRWLGWLIMTDVVDAGGDFVCRVHGTELTRYFGYDMTGKRLSQHLPERHREPALAEYAQAAASDQPLVVTVLERFERCWVRWEKLMLPLTRNGGTVNQVLTGLYRIRAGDSLADVASPFRPDPLPPAHPRLCALLGFWAAKAAGRTMPSRPDLDPVELAPWLRHLSLLQVVDGGRDFRYSVHGGELAAGIGIEMTGKLLSSAPIASWRTAAAEYRACVVAVEPVRIARVHRPGRVNNGWEKLILPLSPVGCRANFLLTSLYPPERAA